MKRWKGKLKIDDIQYVRILLTKKCNLSCEFCHQEGCAYSESDIDYDLLLDTVKKLYDIGYRKVKLMGGEPMLFNRINNIIEDMKKIGTDIDLSIISNGSAPLERYLALFNHGLDRLNMSVHGWDENYFHVNTGGSSLQCNRIKSNIYELAKRGRINKLNYVLKKGQNEGDFFEMLEDVKNLKVVVDVLNLLRFPEQIEAKGLLYSFDEIETIIRKKWTVDKIVDYENPFSLPSKRLFLHDGCVINLKISQLNEHNVFKSCKECKYKYLCVEGIKAIRITNDGRLQPCLLRIDNTLDLVNDGNKIIDYLKEL